MDWEGLDVVGEKVPKQFTTRNKKIIHKLLGHLCYEIEVCL